MKNIQLWLAVGLSALLLFTGCQKQQEPEPELDYNTLVEAPVNVSIDACITEDQVSAVVGYPMTLSGLYEEGTQALFTNGDSSCQVMVNLKNETRSLFDANAADVETTPQEGMGETAYWSVESGELVVHQNGYTLGVWVQLPDGGTANGCIRQIAQQILEKLPTE